MLKRKLLNSLLVATMVITSLGVAPVAAYADETELQTVRTQDAGTQEAEYGIEDYAMDDDFAMDYDYVMDDDFGANDGDDDSVDDNYSVDTEDDLEQSVVTGDSQDQGGYIVNEQQTVSEEELNKEATKQDCSIDYSNEEDPEDPMNGRASGIIDPAFYNDDSLATYTTDSSYDSLTHEKCFSTSAVRKGIDVSSHNGNRIDWNKVKNSGIDFVFVRVGYSSIMGGVLGADSTAMKNLKNAKEAGLKVGAYFYSTAITTAEAEAEAQYMLDLLNGFDLDLPVVMDYEFAWKNGQPGRLNTANLSKEAATANVMAFCNRINCSKYVPMLYANKSFLMDNLNAGEIAQYYQIWLANYGTSTDYYSKYSGRYNYWQFSESGWVDGISGSVDLDVWYDGGYTGLAKKSDGNFYYFYNGTVLSSFVGFVQYTDGKWYFVNHGKVDYTANGLYPQAGGAWYYCHGGVIDWNFTGIAPNMYGNWYAVRNGCYNSGFTGLAPTYNGGFAYAKNGSVQTGFVGFVQYKDGRWYYVDHGFINYGMTGLCPQVGGGWYYARGGVIDWNYTGLARNTYGDWYAVTNGCYDNGYTGLLSNGNGFGYVKNGSIQKNFVGFVQYKDGRWYYVDHGFINYKMTGLCPQVGGDWYYARGGVIDWSYTGLARNTYGDWYAVTNGRYDNSFTGLREYNGGFYYVKNGSLKWNYTGFVQYTDGRWYYVRQGGVNYWVKGLYYDQYGQAYYVEGGRINWNYNGTAPCEDGHTYNVRNGKRV